MGRYVLTQQAESKYQNRELGQLISPSYTIDARRKRTTSHSEKFKRIDLLYVNEQYVQRNH